MTLSILAQLAVILIAAKLAGELCVRWLKQPAVLGEAVVGIVLGQSVLGWIPPHGEAMEFLAELGAVLLLFQVGLESDIKAMAKVGGSALSVALAGILLPFGLGYAAAHALGLQSMEAIFVGTAMTATSVGVTARVFGDLRALQTKEARIVLGAAVVDDVIGLIILAVVSGLAITKTVSIISVARISGMALLFLVGSIGIGLLATPWILRAARAMRAQSAVVIAALAICFCVAALAQQAGLAAIVGAFAAGLVLSNAEEKLHFEPNVKSVADVLVPVFFVFMGAKMDLRAIDPVTAGVGGVLLLTAIVGKVLAGFAAFTKGVRRLVIGVGMVPRGEVGLIFATIGLTNGVIGNNLYSAIVFVVICTTFVTPPALRMLLKPHKAPKPNRI